jgi:hypothetical protein
LSGGSYNYAYRHVENFAEYLESSAMRIGIDARWMVWRQGTSASLLESCRNCCSAEVAGCVPFRDLSSCSDMRTQISGHSLDHLIGAGDQSGGNGDAERLGSLEVESQLKSGWLLDR